MGKLCDNKSVGVIVTDVDGRYALLKRAKFPIRIAPPAGHIDAHGSPEQAALDEVEEELGLIIAPADLRPTSIVARRVDNPCSRDGGTYHEWTVFEADQFVGDITPDPEETQGATWYSKAALEQLAVRTRDYQAGRITQVEWEANPGLEEVWLGFMTELGHIE